MKLQQVELLTSTPPITESKRLVPGSAALRPSQNRVLEAVREVTRRLGVPPARPELAAELGLRTVGSINGHLMTLAATGWVKVLPGIERGLILLREGVALYEPDQLCTNSAETPAEAGANEPAWIDSEPLLAIFGQVPAACLWIRGDAMNRAGLVDGAVVALARRCDGIGRAVVANGDIVAARVKGDVVVRRVQGIGATTLYLCPESTSHRHKTLRVDTRADDIAIVGVVIGRMLPGAD